MIALTRRSAAALVVGAVVVCALVYLSRGFWSLKLGESLTCTEDLARSDALLLENFDPSYSAFKRAAELEQSGFGSRVFIPTATGKSDFPDAVAEALTRIMADAVQIKKFEIIPIVEREPITLTVAHQLRDFLMREKVRSVIVVTGGFRSERSFRIYNAVFSRAGISLHCAPVFGGLDQKNWLSTWHGVQEVFLQVVKSLYYRLFVSV